VFYLIGLVTSWRSTTKKKPPYSKALVVTDRFSYFTPAS